MEFNKSEPRGTGKKSTDKLQKSRPKSSDRMQKFGSENSNSMQKSHQKSNGSLKKSHPNSGGLQKSHPKNSGGQKGKAAPKPAALHYSFHPEYDDAALSCFLRDQLRLFPETVASTPEEAADFLEMCFAVIVRSRKEVRTYFEEAGVDMEDGDILDAAEVFPLGDGRYLIVEG